MAEPAMQNEIRVIASHPEQRLDVGTSPPERQLPETASNVHPIGEWPTPPSRGYDRAARSVGNAIGTVVARAKQIPETVQELRSKFTLIRGRAAEGTMDRTAELSDTAARLARNARSQAKQVAHDYPLQVVLGTAVLGFVIGFMLRNGEEP